MTALGVAPHGWQGCRPPPSVELHDRLARRVARLAVGALLDEPRVWPRFGLVGPDDVGAHQDMEYADLVRSAWSLEPFFEHSFRAGFARVDDDEDATARWRRSGVAAEREMLRASGGVNTHKGAIFLLGLLALSCGRSLRRGGGERSESILDLAYVAMARPLAAELRDARLRLSETYGLWAYRRYRWGGMRHTVLSNFASLRDALRRRKAWRDLPEETRSGLARHQLFVTSQDTNLLKRAGWRATQTVLARAGVALRDGGVSTLIGRRALVSIDREMAERGWSASGSGDLLAAFLLLDRIEGGALWEQS